MVFFSHHNTSSDTISTQNAGDIKNKNLTERGMCGPRATVSDVLCDIASCRDWQGHAWGSRPPHLHTSSGNQCEVSIPSLTGWPRSRPLCTQDRLSCWGVPISQPILGVGALHFCGMCVPSKTPGRDKDPLGAQDAPSDPSRHVCPQKELCRHIPPDLVQKIGFEL